MYSVIKLIEIIKTPEINFIKNTYCLPVYVLQKFGQIADKWCLVELDEIVDLTSNTNFPVQGVFQKHL